MGAILSISRGGKSGLEGWVYDRGGRSGLCSELVAVYSVLGTELFSILQTYSGISGLFSLYEPLDVNAHSGQVDGAGLVSARGADWPLACDFSPKWSSYD